MTSRFHAAVDDAPVGVVIAGLDGSIEVANDRIRDLMRVPDEGSVSLLDFFQDDERDALAGGIERLVSGEVDRIVSERELRRADRTAVRCRLQSSVPFDHHRGPVALDRTT